jgi:hypothetical protein
MFTRKTRNKIISENPGRVALFKLEELVAKLKSNKMPPDIMAELNIALHVEGDFPKRLSHRIKENGRRK